MNAGFPLHSLSTLRAFSAANLWAWRRGSSPFLTVSSIAAGRTASGVMPACASRARRRGLSLARTSTILSKTIGDATLGQVVGRHLDHHFVTGQHSNAILAHFTGGMGDDDVAIGDQLHAEGRIGQQFFYNALELQQFFLGQWVLLQASAGRRYG